MKQYSIQIAGIIGICFLMLTACSSESPADNTSEGKELVVSAEIILRVKVKPWEQLPTDG